MTGKCKDTTNVSDLESGAFSLCLKGGECVARWTEEEDAELQRLYDIHGNKWTQIAELFPTPRTAKQIQVHHRNYLAEETRRRNVEPVTNPVLQKIHKRMHRYNADGSETDVRVIPEEALQTRESLLIAHHYNPHEFELVNSTSNYWDSNQGGGDILTLYQSKITVKPKNNAIDYQAIIQQLESHKEPYQPKNITVSIPKSRYFLLPSFDTHFDGDTLEGYKPSLERTLAFLQDNTFRQSLLILGGDICHVDSINNTTTKGTQLETTNIGKAFDEMEEYYETIIEQMLRRSRSVHVMQLNGNHDNTLGYAFARLLKRAYSRQPNVTFDVDLRQRKATMLGNNMICGSHGDKGKKQYPQLFATEYATLWARATNRELFTGHLHHELTKDDGGILHRQMPTAKEPDTWHAQNGFTMASQRFQLLTYTEGTTESVVYV